MKTKWPNNGSDFNTWNVDFKTFIRAILDAEELGYWVEDTELKYLTIRLDTRRNHFVVYVDDPKNDRAGHKKRIDPQRVIDAIEKH